MCDWNYLLLLNVLTAIFSRTTWVGRHQKGKPFWILLEQEMMGLAVASAGPYANRLYLASDRLPCQYLTTCDIHFHSIMLVIYKFTLFSDRHRKWGHYAWLPASQKCTVHFLWARLLAAWNSLHADLWTVSDIDFKNKLKIVMWPSVDAFMNSSLIMVALCNRADHYIFILFLSSSFFLFFPRLISAVGDWLFTILWHMVWP